MNRRQKSALRSAHIKIADELILDEDFYAALRQNKIFTDSMLSLIKAEKKPRDRVYKMLELLEKRGPKAFDSFVLILKENFEWLADMLEREYSQRRQSPRQEETSGSLQVCQPQFEMDPRYFSMDQNLRQEQYRVCSISALSPRSCQMIPVQVPFSPYVDGVRPNFFPYKPPGSHQQLMHQQPFCDMEHLSVNICSHGNSSVDGNLPVKEYKDACMSPIGIIEPPNKRNSVESEPSSAGNQLEGLALEDKATEQGFVEIVCVASARNGGQTDNNLTDIANKDQSIENNVDTVDGLDIDIKTGNETIDEPTADEDEDNAFPSSEVFYDHVRRGSSCLPEFEKELLLSLASSARNAANSPENDPEDPDEFEDDIDRTDSSLENNQEYLALLDDLKTLYFKLVAINSRNEALEEQGENIVTMDMINNEVDKLAKQLADSDDSKMIRKCYRMFSEKERRLPLNTCIENIFNEKKEIQERLCEKSKNIDQMVYDLWNHQQDMKNIEKLKKTKADLHTENTRLRKANDELKVSLEQQRQTVDVKDKTIEVLEGKLKEVEEKRQFQRRPVPQPQRRTSTASQIQSARRPMGANVPAMSLVHSTYPGAQLQTPRTTTAAAGFRKNTVVRK